MSLSLCDAVRHKLCDLERGYGAVSDSLEGQNRSIRAVFRVSLGASVRLYASEFTAGRVAGLMKAQKLSVGVPSRVSQLLFHGPW